MIAALLQAASSLGDTGGIDVVFMHQQLSAR